MLITIAFLFKLKKYLLTNVFSFNYFTYLIFANNEQY